MTKIVAVNRREVTNYFVPEEEVVEAPSRLKQLLDGTGVFVRTDSQSLLKCLSPDEHRGLGSLGYLSQVEMSYAIHKSLSELGNVDVCLKPSVCLKTSYELDGERFGIAGDEVFEEDIVRAVVDGGVVADDIYRVVFRNQYDLSNYDLIHALNERGILYSVESMAHPFTKSVGGNPPLKFAHRTLGGGFYEVLARDHEHNPVGRLQFSAHPNSDHVEVEHIEVEPPFRGRGYGTELYRYFADLLPHHHATRHAKTVGGEATSVGVYNLARRVLGEPHELSDLYGNVGEDAVYSRLPENSPLEDGTSAQRDSIHHRHVIDRAFFKALESGIAPEQAEEVSHRGTGRWNPDLVAPHADGAKHWLYRDGSVSGNFRSLDDADHTIVAHDALGGDTGSEPLLDFMSHTGAIPLSGEGDGIRATLINRPSDKQKLSLLQLLQHRAMPALKWNIVHPQGYPVKNGVGLQNLSEDGYRDDGDANQTPPDDFPTIPYKLAEGRTYPNGMSDFKLWCQDNGFADPEFTEQKHPDLYRTSLYNWVRTNHRIGEL